MRSLLCAIAVAALVAVTGCGAQTGAGTADPATLAPASTLACATFEIAPQGPEKTGFDAAFGKLLGGAPELELGQALTHAAQTSGKLDYLTDVKPWLGDSVSALVTSVGRDHSDYALLIASTDDNQARAAIQKDLAGSGAQQRSYRSVSYEALPDGTVNGVVDNFVVAGTEAAFKQVVDTSKDGNSLADSQQWKSAVGTAAEGKVGLAFVDVKALLESFASSLPGAQRLAGPLLVGLLQLHPFVATLDAQPDKLVVDVSSPGTPADPRGPGAASSPLIESLPADSWLALAVPKVGQAIGKLAQALQANPLIAGQVQRVLAQVRARTGVDVQKDVIQSVDDVGFFVRGTKPGAVGGALVVQSQHPARLARAAMRVRALVPHVPAAVQVRAARGRAIVAYGSAAARAAVQPSARLGATPLFQAAAVAIGARPTLFVAFGPALQLAAASPRHRGDQHFQQALPRLEHIQYAAVGARRDGGLDVIRAVLGLR